MKTYIGNSAQPIKVQDVPEPSFSGDTPGLIRDRKAIFSGGGLKCSQCGMKSRHNSDIGYCFIHKRIVAMNETCSKNTTTSYKRVNW
jgi:hypothetical protein